MKLSKGMQKVNEFMHREGMHYAIRIALSAYVCWLVFHDIFGLDPLWAVFTVVIVTEPHVHQTMNLFKARVYNTITGCGIGLLFIYTIGPQAWGIPVTMGVSVYVCAHMLNVPGNNWKLGPATAGMVMIKEILDPAHGVGLATAVLRTVEILGGSFISLGVTWTLSKFYFFPDNEEETPSDKNNQGAF